MCCSYGLTSLLQRCCVTSCMFLPLVHHCVSFNPQITQNLRIATKNWSQKRLNLEKPIKYHQMVLTLSWFFSGGQSRYCKAKTKTYFYRTPHNKIHNIHFKWKWLVVFWRRWIFLEPAKEKNNQSWQQTASKCRFITKCSAPPSSST